MTGTANGRSPKIDPSPKCAALLPSEEVAPELWLSRVEAFLFFDRIATTDNLSSARCTPAVCEKIQ